MAKILISFLGTGSININNKEAREYRKATYEIEGKLYKEAFVTKALDKHYNADKVLYIGTLRSMWEEVYKSYFGEEGVHGDNYLTLADSIERFGLKSKVDQEQDEILNAFLHQKKIQPILIQYGLNKNELNYNIRQILKCEQYINSGDDVYIDITHSFRSLPLVLMNVLNYLKDVSKKDFIIKGISYGMLDIARENNNIAPIVQLDVISELHENIKAAHEFNNYGNAYLFSNLLKENCKSMSKILNEFSISKSLNHVYDLKNKIQQFNSFKNEYSQLSPIQEMTIPPVIEDFVNRFNQKDRDSKFQWNLADWMYDNKQFGYAAIVLIEAIVTKVCEMMSFDPKDKEKRDYAKNVIVLSGKSKSIQSKEMNKLKRRYNLKEHDAIVILKSFSDNRFKEFQKIWGQTNKIRKSASHALPTKSNGAAAIKMIKTNLIETEILIKNY